MQSVGIYAFAFLFAAVIVFQLGVDLRRLVGYLRRKVGNR
jgi:hypothetical protein